MGAYEKEHMAQNKVDVNPKTFTDQNQMFQS